MSVEKNLLFGLLAWQNAVISDAQFLAGMRQWSKDKQLSIADVLQDQNALSVEHRRLLEPMVEANIQLHDQDVTRALCSVGSSVDILREARRQIDDADIVRSIDNSTLLSVGGERSDSTPSDPTTNKGSWAAANTNSAGARFRIVRPHARGGLGEVFVAQDSELNREVAVKEIQDRYSDDQQSRERFILEAEVTGSLEHPGIVPVYGLGQYPDGRPYYAMRFIKGDSLKEAIDTFHSDASLDDTERWLQLRKLLGRFVDVCQSISYAHSRGVLHRDLKPGNIMLGKYGETLVVDWGLARIVGGEEEPQGDSELALRPASGSGVTPTVLGSAIGTPAYMPPEQARGAIDEIGSASDVYSLGATLYHVLTGRPPFLGDKVSTVLDDVRAGKFPSPRSVAPNLHKSLEAICVKAMACEAAERYSSPAELADDIERYLADEAVHALPEPITVRAKRWVRKHQAVASTTAATVLLSTVGLAAFSAMLGSKNVELKGLNSALEKRRQALDSALNEVRAANDRETLARQNAEKHAQSAQKQSELALSTLSGVINDLQQSLADLPGGGQVRKRILTTAMTRLSDVSTDFVTQASVDYPTMVALLQMGDLVLQIGNHGTEVDASAEDSASDESISEAAWKFYSRSHDMAMQLATEYPQNFEIRESLVIARCRIGDLYLASGQLNKALEQFEMSRTECAMLLEHRSDLVARRHMAACLNRVGAANLQLGNLPEALERYEESLAITDELLEEEPDNAALISDQIVSYDNMATIHTRQGELDLAQQRYAFSLELAERLSQDSAADAGVEGNVVFANRNVAWAMLKRGDATGAIAQFERVLEMVGDLARQDPGQLLYQRWLADAHSGISDAHLMTGSNAEAHPHIVAAHAIQQRLTSDDKQSVSDMIALAGSYLRLGDNLLALGRNEEADEQYEKQLEVFVGANVDLTQNADVLRSRSTAYERVGEMFLRNGEEESAKKMFDMMLRIKQQLADAAPTDMLAAQELSIAHRHLGDVLVELGDFTGALAEYRILLDQAKQIAVSDPKSVAVQRILANAYFNVAETAGHLHKFAEAAENYQGAIVVQRTMEREGMDSPETIRMAIVDLESSVSMAELAPSAMVPWDELLSRPPAEVRSLIVLRGIIAARTRQPEDCLDVARKMAQMQVDRDEHLYNAACMTSLAVEILKDQQSGDVSETQAAELKELITEAVGYLHQVVAMGYSDAFSIQNDGDLAALRSDKGFAEVVEAARQNSAKLIQPQ